MHSNAMAVVSQEVENLNINDGAHNMFSAYDSEHPPAPKLQSKGVIAMDITEQFVNAATQLDLGQLIKDHYFTLFESVGALEIMDRKMDSGYLEPGETMEDDYDFSKALLPEEILGIIDQLICHEMAWHMGHPLSQTIFTSLYIDRILSPCPLSLDQTLFDRGEGALDEEPLTHQILRAYCLGLIKTCQYVNIRVRSEHYYEEEDFVTHTFNRSLLEGIEHEPILQLIEATSRLLAKSTDLETGIKEALECRLLFRGKFLETVEGADSRTSGGVERLWNDLAAILPDIKSTTNLGSPVPSSFSVKIQRKLASTVPPRPIVDISWEAAFDHLERLCRDACVAVEVLNYHDSHSLLTFVMLFQARKPQPSVYVRTLLQHYVFEDMIILGTMSIRQVLDDDLAALVLPAHVLLDRANDEIEVTHDPRHNMAARMEIFRARAAGSYLDIMRTMCQNRCRIRRTLCHTIADWDNLQLDSEELDQELQQFTKETPILDRNVSDDPIFSFPLSSWSYFYKLRQMEWIVQMGFELEVYQPDELAHMYWYLQYLSKTRWRHIERMKIFVAHAFNKYSQSPDATSEKYSEHANALAFLNFSFVESEAISDFADALSCLYTVLNRLSLIKAPPRPYSEDELRHEVRMKPFISIGLPELVPFGEMSQMVLRENESSSGLLSYAGLVATSAKKGFEILSKLDDKAAFCQGSHDSWVGNIKACLKACIFASIAIAATKRAVDAAKGKGDVKIRVEIPTIGTGYHDWWTVPKVLPVP